MKKKAFSYTQIILCTSVSFHIVNIAQCHIRRMSCLLEEVPVHKNIKKKEKEKKKRSYNGQDDTECSEEIQESVCAPKAPEEKRSERIKGAFEEELKEVKEDKNSC